MSKIKVGPRYAAILKALFLFLIMVSLTAFSAITINAQGTAATPPEQPSSGPGGSDYPYAKVKTSTYGSGELKYWIFEPASPTPDSAPVVVFSHGFLATDPYYYIGWIEHLTKKGNIVIFPAYQQMFTSPSLFTDNTITIVKNALAELESGSHVTPDPDKFVLIGHSAGGALSINLAARATTMGLPVPKAIMLAEPSDGSDIIQGGLFETDLAEVPNTLLLAVAGDQDTIAGSAFSEKVIQSTTKIPAANKDMILLHSDKHGSPILIANHIVALAPDGSSQDPLNEISMAVWGAKVDALDYYGFWKLADSLMQTAFGNKMMRKYALGNTPQQCYMGKWSDGTPVKEMEVVGKSRASENRDTTEPQEENWFSGWINLPVDMIQVFQDAVQQFWNQRFSK